MKQRINAHQVAPEAYKAMLGLEAYVNGSGLEHALLELVKTRASQINGWNRLSIAFRTPAGSYRPRKQQAAE